MFPLRPGTIIDQPRRDLPPAPERLDQPEKEAWDAILREHDINYPGRILLEMGLTSIDRARACCATIDRDGGSWITNRRSGLPRRHPLWGTEIRLLQFARQVFKMLKIELRNDLAH